jgi:hypothetical protein
LGKTGEKRRGFWLSPPDFKAWILFSPITGFGDTFKREGGSVYQLNTGHAALMTQLVELATILFPPIE